MIRGEDHLSNTPKHILLFRALGHEPPVFAHLPLILNPDRTKMSKRKSQTAVDRLLGRGLHPRGARQLPRAARLVDRHGGGDPVARRARRAVRPRPRSTRAAPSSIASGSSGSTASGSGGSPGRPRRAPAAVPRGRAGRPPDRPPAGRRGAHGAPARRPGAAAAARRDRRAGRLPVGRRARARAGAARPEALGRRDDARGPPRRPADDRRGRRASASRPTSSSRRSARSPRRAAGRPATCSWRSASRSPVGRRRRRCSTRSSRSATSGRSSGSTGRRGAGRRNLTGSVRVSEHSSASRILTQTEQRRRDGSTRRAGLARPLCRGVEDATTGRQIGDAVQRGRRPIAITRTTRTTTSSAGATRSSVTGSRLKATRAPATRRTATTPATSRTPVDGDRARGVGLEQVLDGRHPIDARADVLQRLPHAVRRRGPLRRLHRVLHEGARRTRLTPCRLAGRCPERAVNTPSLC